MDAQLLPQSNEKTTSSKKADDDDTIEKDQELWKEVMDEYQEKQLGPEVIPALMSTAKVMWTKRLPQEKLNAKYDGEKIPQNCKFQASQAM